MSQDECGGSFFDKLKRVDWGPVAQACGEYGLFGLGLAILAGGGYPAAGAFYGLLGYVTAKAISNWRDREPLFDGITIGTLGLNLTIGGLFGAANAWYVGSGIAPSSLPWLYRSSDAWGFATIGMAISTGQHLLTDDNPFNDHGEIASVLLSGTLNMVSVVGGGPGIAVTVFAITLGNILTDSTDQPIGGERQK